MKALAYTVYPWVGDWNRWSASNPITRLSEAYFVFYQSEGLAACQTEKPLAIKN